MPSIIDRVVEIMTPFEGAEVASRIGDIVNRGISGIYPKAPVEKVIDDLIATHGISGDDQTFLLGLKDKLRGD